jgi:DNA-directed RNA polymerase specialized sigma24 family protein
VIEFSRPGGYSEVLEAVKVHGYDMARRLGALPSPEDVAADWYDAVYLRGVAALRREALPEMYSYKTDADLFLWICQPAARPARDRRRDRLRRRRPRRPPAARQPQLPPCVPAREESTAAAARLVS